MILWKFYLVGVRLSLSCYALFPLKYIKVSQEIYCLDNITNFQWAFLCFHSLKSIIRDLISALILRLLSVMIIGFKAA